MANEYLTRTPTSCGNRHVHTVSVWAKVGNSNTQKYRSFFAAGSSSPNPRSEYGLDSNGKYNMGINDNGSLWHQAVTTALAKYSDGGSWMHFCVSVNSTLPLERDRIRFWINGSIYPYTVASPLNINANTPINDVVGQYIGRYVDPSQYWDGELSDFFLVDGQALTPDVFGFYKQGKGYQSSGTTKATDFRPGQWSPHSPRTIKNAINRTGGFGVNGIYLPMNDSSNFGADFHCDPNSIINLKGEDLPQPRNGLPTTSDSYVSQLREDPYAANLVLAVPGVELENTNPELVTNGDFSNGTTGWTGLSGGSLSVEDGKLKITETTGAVDAYACNSTAITTVVGRRYTIKWTFHEGTNTSFTIRFGNSGNQSQEYQSNTGANGYGSYPDPGTYSFTFTATATTLNLSFIVNQASSYGYVSNVSVKEAVAVRDYSADIKGSGTNKTMTEVGLAGVYPVPSYYGSAMTFDGNGDYVSVPNTSDLRMGSDDFTVECWLYAKDFTGGNGLVGLWNYSGGLNRRSWLLYTGSSNEADFIVSSDGTSSTQVVISSPANMLTINQWNHIVGEKEGTIIRLYVNGVVVATSNSAPSSLYENTDDTIKIGTWDAGSGEETNGYIQDVRVYKGVAKYKGGFDVSKPYTPVGIETWRQVPDTCKNNFATLNPLDAVTSNQSGTDYTQATHSNGNLTVILSDDFSSARGSIGISTGKYYWEIRVDDNTNSPGMGVIAPGNQLTSYNSGANGASYEPRGDRFRKNGVNFYDGTNNKTDDGLIVGVALDKNVGIVSFFADGTLLSNGTMTGLNDLSDVHIPECFTYNDGSNVDNTYTWNFGQNPSFSGQTTAGTYTDSSGKGLFKYEPPTGFLALCEDNLPTPAIADPGKHFKTLLWTGDGRSYRSITGCGFTPDFVWIKVRNAVNSHYLFDTIRGADKALFTDLRDDENDYNGSGDGRMPSFDPDGFTVSHSSSTGTNESDDDYVAWCWKAGGPAVSNNDGSIAAQISVNQDAGFSILSYTGNGTSGTVGHGLGKTPNIVICKNRADDLTNWSVNGNFAGLVYGTNKLMLQSTGGITADTNEVTSANATTITLGNSSATNDSNDAQIAYCWTEVEGYSKFGSYTGTGGTDGAFVYCGFKPAFLMIKRTDAAGEWWMYDSSRGSTNPIPRMLMANNTSIEQEDSGSYLLDFVSNGFKWRSGLAASNGDGNSYFFMAFAESPLQTANAK